MCSMHPNTERRLFEMIVSILADVSDNAKPSRKSNSQFDDHNILQALSLLYYFFSCAFV